MKKTQENHTQESEEVSPFPAGDHKAAKNRQDSIIKTNMKHNKKDPQKKQRHETIEKNQISFTVPNSPKSPNFENKLIFLKMSLSSSD